MKQARFWIALIFCVCMAGNPLFAAGEKYQSAARQTTLLEMYGSEGCSSCPPADVWISRLKKDPKLWKEFIPVTFHVDYWDNLGWKDPFASPVYTQRQGVYSQAWGAGGSLYTPGFVANGQEWRGWHNQSVPVSSNFPGVLTVEAQPGNQYRVTFEPSAAGEFEAYIAILGFDIKSDVKRGENAGKVLTHDFVALAYQRRPMEGRERPTVNFQFSLKDFPDGQYGIAVWVTRKNETQPLQAAGGYLNK